MRVQRGTFQRSFCAIRTTDSNVGGSVEDDGVGIDTMTVEGEDVVIRLANPSASTRVHLFATRNLPAYDGVTCRRDCIETPRMPVEFALFLCSTI